MKLWFCLITVLGLIDFTTQGVDLVTPNAYERIEKLKQLIKEQIFKGKRYQKKLKNKQIDIRNPSEEYEYVQPDNNAAVTPVMDYDERKKGKRFLMKQLKRTHKKSSVHPEKSKPDYKVLRQLKHQVKEMKLKMDTSPIETFYRRSILKNVRHRRIREIHCQDLITPFLKGMKKDFSFKKRVLAKDHVVKRLLSLLNVNLTDFTQEDIYSVMYQISNLQLRMFQWDGVAIKTLLETIITGPVHSFRNLKAGLKSVFSNWRLDISNTTNLLKQSRIFRPPCVRPPTMDGSTKNPKRPLFIPGVTKESTTCTPSTADPRFF